MQGHYAKICLVKKLATFCIARNYVIKLEFPDYFSLRTFSFMQISLLHYSLELVGLSLTVLVICWLLGMNASINV